MKLKLALVCSAALLSACVNSAQVQRNYISTRDQCRARAEGDQGQYTGNQQLSDRDRNAVLASLFSDCMFQMGWTVATPPRDGGGGDGGIIDTARQKPQEQALVPERTQTGNMTLQPSPLPLGPTEKNAQSAAKPVPTDTQFPHSTYQSIPPSSSTAKGNAKQGGVAVVTPAKQPSAQAAPAPLTVKKTTTPAEKEGLTPDQQESILDSLNHGR